MPAWPTTTRTKTREAWTRARRAVTCGCCNGPIAAGDPVLEIIGQTWRKVRCVRCAGGEVPAVIEDQPSPAQEIRINFAERIASIRGVARDWKHAQGGDRG